MNVKDIRFSPEQWASLLQRYGVDERALSGKAGPCPVCGGTDRFTYDNKRGRGDWICRKCNDGGPKAGDGFELICQVAKISLGQLMRQLEGRSDVAPLRRMSTAAAPAGRRRASPEFVAKRLGSMWSAAKPLTIGDLAMRYLQARVPGLRMEPTKALRLGMLEYRHEKKAIGRWPGILARFELPDGRLGTLHRTFLDRSQPAKAQIVSADGEILQAKLNDMTLNPLRGGAVRLMDPIAGEIGVAEGLETAYASHALFGVPVWYCLNRILLEQFVVPEGLGIRVVHIFVDYDAVDAQNGKSPGVSAGVTLAKRLRADGYTAIIHRPKQRGTDFADEWLARWTNRADAERTGLRQITTPFTASAALQQ